MLDGEVRPPGVFLEATVLLERQLIACCFDRWAASGIDDSGIPGPLRQVLDGVDSGAGERFPHSFLQFIDGARAEILRRFRALFSALREVSQGHLRGFLEGAQENAGIRHRLTDRLHQVVEERKSLTHRIDRLLKWTQHLDALERTGREQYQFADVPSHGLLREVLCPGERGRTEREEFPFLQDDQQVGARVIRHFDPSPRTKPPPTTISPAQLGPPSHREHRTDRYASRQCISRIIK